MLQCFVNQNAHVYIKTVNMTVFFVKSNENTYPKGRALMHMYRVVPITKRGNPLLIHMRHNINTSNSSVPESCKVDSIHSTYHYSISRYFHPNRYTV